MLSHTRQPYHHPRLSPDGRQLAALVLSEPSFGIRDLWRLDLEKDLWTRLTFNRASTPEWAPDGRWLAFKMPAGELMRMPLDGGAPEPLSEPLGNVYVNAWTRDGRALVFVAETDDRSWDIGLLSLDSHQPTWFLNAAHAECSAALSPDGRYMAYVSNESGRCDIYVRPFPGGGERHLLSTNGGMQPRWSRDGSEIFYRSLGDRPKFMAVPVQTGSRFSASAPRALFDDNFHDRDPLAEPAYDVSPDGRSFVFIEEPPDAPGPTRFVLIPDWSSELRAKRLSARR
jgi:Tol biopolymer transport system component